MSGAARKVAAAMACTVIGTARVFAVLTTVTVVSGLDHPIGFVQHPTDPSAQIILEQGGRARVLKHGALGGDFLNLTGQIASGGEQGLLGLAFAPDFAVTGRVFASFTNLAGHSVIARFTRMAGDPLRLDPSSRFDLAWPDGQRFITQPFANHNGGNLAFGPDGLLYAGFGDGGSANDPMNNAQNGQSLLGKMLRLDVSVPDTDLRGYRIPATNPFVGRAGVLGEIWDAGLRNPWRWSFDDPKRGGTGALVIADVGQDAWEEIDYEPAGAGGRNFGWRIREGAHDDVAGSSLLSLPLVDPTFEYSHNVGKSITGGYIYRGTALGAAYVGRYFFADFITSRVWSMGLTVNGATHEAAPGTVVEHTAELGSAAVSTSSFGVDAGGELYLVSYSGTIYRIVSDSPAAPFVEDGRHQTSGETKGTAHPR